MENLMQLIEALVNAETEDERMALVAENKEMIDSHTNEGAGAEEMQTALDEAIANGDALTQSLAEAKQLYKDTFFGKAEVVKEDTDEVDEADEADTGQTLDELLAKEKEDARQKANKKGSE